MNSKLSIKIDKAIRLLQNFPNELVELCYSGGKDSDIILRIAQMAGINYKAIYKNTTIDPPGTIQHCIDNGVFIQEPEFTFFQLIEHHGFPTRRARFCCENLKEYKILDTAIQGIRREESSKRAKNYHEPVICRLYNRKSDHVNVILPILNWSKRDVWDFVRMENIKLHPLYYRADGSFDVNRRLGCIGCPLAADNGLADFKAHPVLVRKWIEHGLVWWNKERAKPMGCQIKFNDIYELFAHNVFYKSYDDFIVAKNGLFGTMDYKQLLCDYFQIDL